MTEDIAKRLEQQVEFIKEIDRLKHIFRQSYLLDTSRRENDAEHSWHLAMLAILLHEYAAEDAIDLLRVLKMILIHDIVEIDAGDTYCYDEKANEDKEQRERRAADRLFGLLPADQRDEFQALWEEFEAMNSPESKFAAALDRFQPLLLNYFTDGKSWREHDIARSQVLQRNERIGNGAPALWEYASAMIEDAVKNGWLRDA